MKVRLQLKIKQENHVGFFTSLLAFYITGGLLVCLVAYWSS